MLKVGLTGGIATGKTFVSEILKGLGARAIDADKLSREAVLPGMEPYNEIARKFGREVLDGEGYIDRQILGSIVFSNRRKLQELEAIIHPYVICEQERLLTELAGSSPSCVALVDAPLLIEAGVHLGMDKVIIVTAEHETMIQRALSRGGIDREEVLRRIAAQMPLSDKVRYGDYIIDNNGSRESTERQVTDIWLILSEMAKSGRKR